MDHIGSLLYNDCINQQRELNMTSKKTDAYVLYFHNGEMEGGDWDEAQLTVSDADITFEQAHNQLLSSAGAIENGWAKTVDDKEEIEDFLDCLGTDSFVGAWMVPIEITEKFKEILEVIPDAGGDSEAYGQQVVWKGIYKVFSIKEIGKKATK